MALRFEFDTVSRILLMRFEARFTEETLTKMYSEIRKHAAATDASAGIWDFSPVTEFAVSAEFIRHIASPEPAIPDTSRRRFIVVPNKEAHGLARMFEMVGEGRNPLLRVVYSIDEALAALGVSPPHFEAIE
jgi:hypothetical protein